MYVNQLIKPKTKRKISEKDSIFAGHIIFEVCNNKTQFNATLLAEKKDD